MNKRIVSIAAGLVFAVLIASGCTPTREQSPASAFTDDRVITSAIKTRYAESKNLDLTNISVETLYGVVLLSGVAKSLEEKIAATNIAEQIDGVKAVHDAITLQPDAPSQDTSPKSPAASILAL